MAQTTKGHALTLAGTYDAGEFRMPLPGMDIVLSYAKAEGYRNADATQAVLAMHINDLRVEKNDIQSGLFGKVSEILAKSFQQHKEDIVSGFAGAPLCISYSAGKNGKEYFTFPGIHDSTHAYTDEGKTVHFHGYSIVGGVPPLSTVAKAQRQLTNGAHLIADEARLMQALPGLAQRTSTVHHRGIEIGIEMLEEELFD